MAWFVLAAKELNLRALLWVFLRLAFRAALAGAIALLESVFLVFALGLELELVLETARFVFERI